MTTFKKGDWVRDSDGNVGVVTRMGHELHAPCVWATWAYAGNEELWSRFDEITLVSDTAARWHAFSRLSDALHRINVAARNGDTALITELAQAVEALADKAER